MHLRETPRCLKIGTCFTQAKATDALLQSSDEAEAGGRSGRIQSVSDTHFPSTIALFLRQADGEVGQSHNTKARARATAR